ncbi:MAG: hypothetical protein IVW54_20475 [Candidatus Binataceae bacterium]|nr:hypothetical protein [Candidatus Binataceae bacterium]
MIVASYGIRRSSHEVPHDYISKQLFISTRQAIDLARCPLSRDDYFEILRLHQRLPKMICESCRTEDFDRQVSVKVFTLDGKPHNFKLCSDCNLKAEKNDSATWGKLRGAHLRQS